MTPWCPPRRLGRQPVPHVSRTSPMRDRGIPRNARGASRGAITSDILKSNYGLFNRSNIYIRSWSWNYRGCWHQTCPPIDTQQCVLDNSPLQSLIHGVQQSCYFSSLPRQYWHWAICAPAAHRSDGCRFSGTLSGIEPQFSVTRHWQGSQLYYLQPDRW